MTSFIEEMTAGCSKTDSIILLGDFNVDGSFVPPAILHELRNRRELAELNLLESEETKVQKPLI